MVSRVEIRREKIEDVIHWIREYGILRPAVDEVDVAMVSSESMDLKEFSYRYSFVLPYDVMWTLFKIMKARHLDAKLAPYYEEDGMGKVIRVRQYTFSDLSRTDIVGGIMGFRYRPEDLISRIGVDVTLPRIVNIKTRGRYVKNIMLDNGFTARKFDDKMASRINYRDDAESFRVDLEMRLPFIVFHLPEDPIMDIEFTPNIDISEIEFIGVVFEAKVI